MTRYCVRIGLWIRPAETAGVGAFTERLAEELFDLDPEADLMGSITSGTFQAWVHQDAESVEAAVAAGSATIRSAGHAAGASTATWPSADEWPQWIEARSVEAHVVEGADHHDAGDEELVDA
jgi:hypothetical protein